MDYGGESRKTKWKYCICRVQSFRDSLDSWSFFVVGIIGIAWEISYCVPRRGGGVDCKSVALVVSHVRLEHDIDAVIVLPRLHAPAIMLQSCERNGVRFNVIPRTSHSSSIRGLPDNM